MASFRGIGDSATQVKMQQDQMGLQAALSREARASSEAQAAASRAESARQFNVSAGMQQGRLAEDARRFDATLGANRENMAWERSQAEKKMAEDTRRFGIAQEAAARAEQRQERELDLQQFGAELNALRTASAMEGDTLERQKSRAQLDQYLMATAEEKRAKANREKIAKGAFGSMVIAGRLNGGVIPTKALEIANQELGDKDNQIVGGGFDENTGLAFFLMKNLKDNTVKQLNMTPENQYAAIHEGIGAKEADMFADTYKIGSASRAGIERKRLEYKDRAAFETEKQKARLEAERNDPVKQAEMFQKQADTFAKRAEGALTKEDMAFYMSKARESDQRAADLRESVVSGKTPSAAEQPFVLTPEIMEKNGIPNGAQIVTDKKTGEQIVTWIEDGKVVRMAVGKGGAKETSWGSQDVMKNATTMQRAY